MTIEELKEHLKGKNYKKRGLYWYCYEKDFIKCIQWQKSQWDSNNYYINIGFALLNEANKTPTFLHWYCARRCEGEHRDLNLSFEDFLIEEERYLDAFNSLNEMMEFVETYGNKISSTAPISIQLSPTPTAMQ